MEISDLISELQDFDDSYKVVVVIGESSKHISPIKDKGVKQIFGIKGIWAKIGVDPVSGKEIKYLIIEAVFNKERYISK